MSEFGFDLVDAELSFDEEQACIEGVVNTANRLFGPAQTHHKRHSTETLHEDGQFARLSRLAIRDEEGLTFSFNGFLFIPDRFDLTFDQQEEGVNEPDLARIFFTGQQLIFNIYCRDQRALITRTTATLWVNYDNEVEFDSLVGDNVREMQPRESDRSYLECLEAILTR